MADLNGGHLVARTLKQVGVGHIFTLCGGHILPIYDGCVTGVANAFSARSPMLLIGGAAPLGLRGLGSLQEVEQVDLLRPITKGAWTVSETRQIPEVLTTAIRHALTGRPGPVFVEIPADLLMTVVEDRLAPIPTDYVHRRPVAPDAESVQRLAELLGRAAHPVVMAGSGVYWDDAAKDLQSFTERAGVPVFMNGAGRGCLPSDHPNAFAQSRGFALGQADFVLVLGTPLDFRLGYGRPPSFAENAQVAMVDCDPVELGRNRPLALGLTSHIGLTLRQLQDALPQGLASRFEAWREAVKKKEADGQARLMVERRSDSVPISHYRLGHEIAAVVDATTTVVGDGGDVVGCASKVVTLARPGQWLDPGPFGCLGVGPCFAIAAKLLRPEQRVLLIAGDGAFGLNGMDIETAVRFRLPLTCVIGNDGGWGQIRNPQLSFFGAERAVGTSLPFTRFDQVVEALGGKGVRVTEPRQIRPSLERALGSSDVHCINVILDPAAYRRTGQVSMAI